MLINNDDILKIVYLENNVPAGYIAVYTKDEIVDRARSRLFEEDYNVVINNCEHFAVWCRLGEKSE